MQGEDRIGLVDGAAELWSSVEDDGEWGWMYAMVGNDTPAEIVKILRKARDAGLNAHVIVGDGWPTQEMTEFATRVVPGCEHIAPELRLLAAGRKAMLSDGGPTATVVYVLLGARPLFEADPEGWQLALEACPDGEVSVLTVVDHAGRASFAGSERLRDACTTGGVLIFNKSRCGEGGTGR